MGMKIIKNCVRVNSMTTGGSLMITIPESNEVSITRSLTIGKKMKNKIDILK